MDNKKMIIGILGGICSGKSAVAREFEKLGCKVIDADKIAHDLLGDGQVKQQIVNSLGNVFLNTDGSIDRGKLAEIVFEGKENVEIINSIIHPLVMNKTQDLIEQYNSINDTKPIVLDAALLMEVGWEKKCDKLVFVDCKAEIRAQRAKKRGISLKKREKFQILLDNKRKIADYIVNNSSDFSEMTEQVVKIFTKISG